MNVTVIVPMIEGSPDEDYPIVVVDGHMTVSEITTSALIYGSGYQSNAIVGNKTGFFATFSNYRDAPLDEDGNIEFDSRGQLTLSFFLTYTRRTPPEE